MTCFCPRDLTFPWLPYFDRNVFLFKISISLILKVNKSFLVVFFKSLEHSMVFLFVLIIFEPILDSF